MGRWSWRNVYQCQCQDIKPDYFLGYCFVLFNIVRVRPLWIAFENKIFTNAPVEIELLQFLVHGEYAAVLT